MTEPTSEYIRRDGYHYVSRGHNHWRDEDCTLGMVRTLLAGALASLEGLTEVEEGAVGPRGVSDGGAIDTYNASLLRVAYELTQGISGFFPSIIAWTVTRTVGSGGRPTTKTVWDACFTRAQAERSRKAWAAKEGKLAKRHGWTPDIWEVELGEARLTALLDPDCDIEKHVAESGAFKP